MNRTLRVAAASAAATVVAVLGFAGAASAHVSVSPATATAGGDVRIAFLVPTESDTASTVKVEVQVPTDKPIAGLATAPVPGWTVTTKTTGPTRLITWTADTPDAGIRPGQFQEFPVALEGLPDTDRIVFKVLQTYSDGTVVRWIDETVAGQPEPEHPAPVLTLAKGDATVAATPVPDRAPLYWSMVAVVLGLVGAVLGGLAFLRSRRTTD
jgi:uncharacterized protein YcnI